MSRKCEFYFDCNDHFLDTAGLKKKKTIKLLKLKKKKTPTASFADKKKVQLSLPGKNLVIFLTTFLGWMGMNSIDKPPIFQMLILNKSPNMKDLPGS